MLTIGLIGGTSYVSTIDYYRIINKEVNKRLGKAHSAKCILHSLDLEEMKTLTMENRTAEIADILVQTTKKLEQAGALLFMLCANTLHMVADEVTARSNIPCIHIALETGKIIQNKELKKVGLLGTRFTMELPFYRDTLNKMGIEVIIPEENDREFINYSIYEEFTLDIFKSETKERYLDIIEKLGNMGAEGIIMGCTEIPLLINQDDTQLCLFNTTEIHAKAAVDAAFRD